MTDECGKTVYWWEGEYEGECLLPKCHPDQCHYDGVSVFDDDGHPRFDLDSEYHRKYRIPPIVERSNPCKTPTGSSQYSPSREK